MFPGSERTDGLRRFWVVAGGGGWEMASELDVSGSVTRVSDVEEKFGMADGRERERRLVFRMARDFVWEGSGGAESESELAELRVEDDAEARLSSSMRATSGTWAGVLIRSAAGGPFLRERNVDCGRGVCSSWDNMAREVGTACVLV